MFQFEKRRGEPDLTTKNINCYLALSHQPIKWKEHLMPNTKQIQELTIFFS
jgi:hypothetical protein